MASSAARVKPEETTAKWVYRFGGGQTEGRAEMREFITEAWRMVVPKRVAAAHLSGLPSPPPG